MVKLLALLLLLTCAAAQTPSAPQAQSPAPTADDNAHKAKTLIDRMIQALGGQAWLNLQTVSQEGRTYSFYHDQPTGAGALYWRFWKWPDKDRIELTKQRDWIILHTGDKGYEITFRGVTPEVQKNLDDYLRRRDNSLEYVVRKWLNQPGTALFYEGHSLAARKQAERVTVLNSENQGVTIDIDVVTHLPIQRTFSWRDPADKQRNEEVELYDNYKTVQGIATPMSVTRMHNGDMTNQKFITSVEYNRDLSDSLFSPTPDALKHK
jgi:hypothetical protein